LAVTDKGFLAALLLFTFIIVFAFCWQPGYLDDDSLAYAQTASLMSATGQWLNFPDPSYGGPFYYHFPLVIWVTALIFKLFGVSVISATIFSLLSCLLAVIALFYFGKLLKDSWTGFFSACVFLLINFTPRLARQCRMDMPLTLFLILSIYFFAKAYQGKKINYLLFGLFAGLTIMAKDVFGLSSPAIAIIFLLARRRFKELINPYFALSLLLVFVPVLTWIALEQKLYAETMFSKWWRWNFLNLLAGKHFQVPFYYYPLEIFKKYFYFIPFFIYGAGLGLKQLRRCQAELPLLVLIWAIFIPLAFSFGRQKLHYFIYSMYPAFALLSGLALEYLCRQCSKEKLFKIMVASLIIFGLIRIFIPFSLTKAYFMDVVKITPAIDKILVKPKLFEFYTFNQDDSALIFYSKELENTKRIKSEAELENKLKFPALTIRRFFLFNQADFDRLPQDIKERYFTLLQVNGKIVLGDKRD
jgi:4-amino-4-deoxy-L-arabinose transferase-like glycosyltransferase